jgi:putative endonuclease
MRSELTAFPAKAGNYYVYILASKKEGMLYIGVTNNLQRRVSEHKSKLNKGYTKRHNIGMLVYFEDYQYINDAIKREKNMKKWKRQWKINLIEKENPFWLDLSCLRRNDNV